MMKNLHHANKITLFRVENGWVASNDMTFIDRGGFFCFESTESLAKQLVELIGPSGWKVVVPQKEKAPRKMPDRLPNGKFVPRDQKPATVYP